MNLCVPMTGPLGRFRSFVRALTVGALGAGLLAGALAAAPPAGTKIGNQASATYTDSSGQTRAATSNLVETTVQQVGSFTLTQDNSKTASVGNTVYLPHTLTNTGNGTDTFTLATSDVASADTDFTSSFDVYLDANGDGLPDNTTPLCTGSPYCSVSTPGLASGAVYRFVVAVTVPAGASAGATDQVSVTATGGTPALYDTASQSNTDSITVTQLAAFQVNKSVNLSQGPVGTTLTFTLSYQNIGGAAGTLALYDQIGTGATAGFAYVPGSAVWSAGATALSDSYSSGTPDATVGGMEVHYKASTLGAVTTLQANITNVAPNVSGTLRFNVQVLSTATPGTTSTTNTGYYGSDTDSNPEDNSTALDSSQPTNLSSYQVQTSAAIVANDGTAGPTDGSNTRPAAGDTDAPANADLLYQASAAPGQSLSYPVVIWNTGNGTDTMNLTASGLAGAGYGTWPTGTTFQLLKSDGASPLLDTNNDGVPDTGPVAAGSSQTVVLRVVLPSGACASGCPSGPFDVEVTATSTAVPSVSNPTYARLGSVQPPSVDLANSPITADTGTNADAVGGTPTTTVSTLPGQRSTFSLYLRNEGTVNDVYDLAYSGSNFAAGTGLPGGWAVEFRTSSAGSCSTTSGTVITSMAVAAGAEQHFCAVVSVQVGATPGETALYFRAVSQVTGASDTKYDAVSVQVVRSLTLAPSHTGQVYPGGTVVYPHTLSNTGNTGNTSCGAGLNFSLSPGAWTAVLYDDVNRDGKIDAGDTPIDLSQTPDLAGVTLAVGEQRQLLVKVFAPAGAAAGSAVPVSLSASATCESQVTTSNTVTDTSTVVTGQVRLSKVQALDAACDGVADAAYTAEALTAKPGQCLLYRVTATNEGLGDATALSIHDALPGHTASHSALPTCSAGTAAYVAPTYSCTGITLAPGASATLDFEVRVNP